MGGEILGLILTGQMGQLRFRACARDMIDTEVGALSHHMAWTREMLAFLTDRQHSIYLFYGHVYL